MTRLSEMTSTYVDFDEAGDPNHWVVGIMEDTLFRCPFVMTSDVGDDELEPGGGDAASHLPPERWVSLGG